MPLKVKAALHMSVGCCYQVKDGEQQKSLTVIGSLELAETAGAAELAKIIHACTCTRTHMNTVAVRGDEKRTRE